jgi:hypothetical protein
MEPLKALELLFSHAIMSSKLPPAALPELQELAKIVQDALTPKETENGK